MSEDSQTGPAPFLDLVPLLMCADVQASIPFYTDVLGFEVTGRDDDVGATGFAALANGRARVMLASGTYVPGRRRWTAATRSRATTSTSRTPKRCARP